MGRSGVKGVGEGSFCRHEWDVCSRTFVILVSFYLKAKIRVAGFMLIST